MSFFISAEVPVSRQDNGPPRPYWGSMHLTTPCTYVLSMSALADKHITLSLAIQAGHLCRIYLRVANPRREIIHTAGAQRD